MHRWLFQSHSSWCTEQPNNNSNNGGNGGTDRPNRQWGNGDEMDNRFLVSEIGLFQPDLEEHHGKNSVVTIGKDTYFRDVFLFVERAKGIVERKGERYHIVKFRLQETFGSEGVQMIDDTFHQQR